ncbi:MAG: hypothetical protein ABWK53_05745 [Anaerolineales bacterium]
MDELQWERLTEIHGRAEAELLESYLEAHGIDVELIQEAVGRTIYPVTVNGLGLVQVFVPKSRLAEARELLRDFQ